MFKYQFCMVMNIYDVRLLNSSLRSNGHSIDVVYLDFQKAFDTVPYHRLLQKLYLLVFMHGNVLKWIENFYLTGSNELYPMAINL